MKGWAPKFVRVIAWLVVSAAGVACGSSSYSDKGDAAQADDGGVASASDAAPESAPSLRDGPSLPEAPDASTDGPVACLALGALCQPGVPCCQGTCTGNTTCRLAAGDPCTPMTDWCGGALECDPDTSTCAQVKCFENNKNSTLCGAFPSIECCDPQMVCQKLGVLAGYGCCLPSGTPVTSSQASRCCSSSLVPSDAGGHQCG